MMSRWSWSLQLLLIALAGPASAHEFYLELDSHQPRAGGALRVGLREGERFAGRPYPRDAQKIERFCIVGPAGESPVVGSDGKLLSFARVSSPGVYVLGYVSKPHVTRMEADAFERYLREEGLDDAARQRAAAGESSHPARDAYQRCAKALLCTADAADQTGFDRTLGHPLEITPAQNPFQLNAGAELAVRVTFRGQPLPGATVVFVQQAAPRELIRVVTDDAGRAAARLVTPGRWMVTTVSMQRSAPGDSADWDSFWASLTFETPGGAKPE